jgi:hypothetical protein
VLPLVDQDRRLCVEQPRWIGRGSRSARGIIELVDGRGTLGRSGRLADGLGALDRDGRERYRFSGF